VQLSLCLIKYHAMKTRDGGIAPRNLNLGTRWFTPGKKPTVPIGQEVGWAS